MKSLFSKPIKLLLSPYHNIKKWGVQLAYVRRCELAWKDLSQSKSIMLELGSGFKKGVNGWTTVDLEGAYLL